MFNLNTKPGKTMLTLDELLEFSNTLKSSKEKKELAKTIINSCELSKIWQIYHAFLKKEETDPTCFLRQTNTISGQMIILLVENYYLRSKGNVQGPNNFCQQMIELCEHVIKDEITVEHFTVGLQVIKQADENLPLELQQFFVIIGLLSDKLFADKKPEIKTEILIGVFYAHVLMPLTFYWVRDEYGFDVGKDGRQIFRKVSRYLTALLFGTEKNQRNFTNMSEGLKEIILKLNNTEVLNQAIGQLTQLKQVNFMSISPGVPLSEEDTKQIKEQLVDTRNNLAALSELPYSF